MDTVRTILAIDAKNKWHVYQMYVKYAFLNGYSGGGSICGTTKMLQSSMTREQSIHDEKGNLWFEASS